MAANNKTGQRKKMHVYRGIGWLEGSDASDCRTNPTYACDMLAGHLAASQAATGEVDAMFRLAR
jgi:hypothetical protein